MQFIWQIMKEAWLILNESAIFVIFGLLVSGLLRMFLQPDMIARHLGRGRFSSVIKAAFIGVPIPLCSCGVLPAAVSLRKQGAGKGATTAFLISTPESGVDSIAVTYALLDPLMTVIRPAAAFVTAILAGFSENMLDKEQPDELVMPDLSCPVDGCCDGKACTPEAHRRHHTFFEKIRVGLRFAFTDLWPDMAGWFFIGILLAGFITAIIPDDMFTRYLGGGLPAMLTMLVVGIPLYICATASTPIAAALILKGVSPGAALVFLLAGPATNITSLTVLFGTLGKRATVVYFAAIAVCAVGFGLFTDGLYQSFDISIVAAAGEAGKTVPDWLQFGGAVLLLISGIWFLSGPVRNRLTGSPNTPSHAHLEPFSSENLQKPG